MIGGDEWGDTISGKGGIGSATNKLYVISQRIAKALMS